MFSLNQSKLTSKENKRVSIKFFILLAILVSYFLYLSHQYDMKTGGVVSALTWSFFVLCTPVADAGFLLDFPIRLLLGVRMFLSEMMVWGLAISINLICYFWAADYYQSTPLMQIFYLILGNPFPYWSIILISGLGTFLSVQFGDELMDVLHPHQREFFLKHHSKYELILIAFGFAACFFAYFALVDYLGLAEYLGEKL